MSTSFKKIYKLIFGFLGIIAIVSQLIYTSTQHDLHIINFFSYFTILSNILASFVLLFTAVSKKRIDTFRGAVVLYMVITGIVFALLLEHYAGIVDTMLPWGEIVLHRVIPIAVLLDWLIDPPVKKIAYKEIGMWLLFPLLFAVYTLIRGPLVHWYPYPFLNPSIVNGYMGVCIYIFGICIGASICGGIVIYIGNLRVKKRKL